jgi:hypothetical protein
MRDPTPAFRESGARSVEFDEKQLEDIVREGALV